MSRLLPREKKFLERVHVLLEEIQDDIGERTTTSRSLTNLQLTMLLETILFNEPTMKELTESLNVSTSTLYKATEKLIELGFCEKVDDIEDARIKRLKTTPKFERIVRNTLK
ncbi:MAG: winged helix DNA-binding protein [Bacillota bacterium]